MKNHLTVLLLLTLFATGRATMPLDLHVDDGGMTNRSHYHKD